MTGLQIVWYQPNEFFAKKRLIHLCSGEDKTLCGLNLSERWILWNWNKEEITCKKCKKLEAVTND